MLPIMGRPRRWRQRRKLPPAVTVLKHADTILSRQTSSCESSTPSGHRPQPDDDLFDASSVTSLETSLDPDGDSSSDTDDESASEGDVMDNSSSYYDLISQYEDEGPIMANRGESAKKMIRTEDGKWKEQEIGRAHV